MKPQIADNSQRPRRVVFFHDSHGFGGMELYLFRLIQHLDSSRYIPAVLVPGFTDLYRSSSDRVIEEIQSTGVPLLRSSNPGSTPIVSAYREMVGIAQILRDHRADILHIHTCRPEGARKVTMAARLANIRAVVRTEHFPPSITSKPSTWMKVRPMDWLTSYIITGSEGDRQEQINLLRRPPSKVIRSYNSVELEKFNPDHDVRLAKTRICLDPEIPVIVTVGRLIPVKGQCYLINAVAQVIEQFGPVNLLLVGEGELQPEFEALAARLGITAFVHFVGFQKDVIPYIEAADIGAMPSLSEVFSLAMLEMMALGKPIVTSDHSSFLEAITDCEQGLIVPRKDSKRLGDALYKLLNDENLRKSLGQAALQRVRMNFGFHRLVNDMMGLYDRVLAETNHKQENG